MSKKIDVEFLAKLIQVKLTPTESSQFSQEIPQTLEAINNLNELDTNKVKPTFQTGGIINRFLQEKINERSLSPQKIFQNVKTSTKGFFQIPGLKYDK